MRVQTCLIRQANEVAMELQAALGAEAASLRVLDGADGLASLLEPPEPLRAVLAVEDAAEVDVVWLRDVRRRAPQAQFLVVARTCDEETWRRLLLAGCQGVLRLPVGSLDLDDEFASEPALSHLFRRHTRLHEQGKAMFRYTLPSDPQYIPGIVHVVALLAMEFGFSRVDYTMNLPLAVDEALSNAIVHGNRRDLRKRIEVEGMIDAGLLRLKVRDEGEGFRREDAGSPLEGDNLLSPSGRGLFLIESVMDEVRYSQDGRCIEMIKRIPGVPARP